MIGWSGSPATFVARPSSTVTCIAQVSGQSCGQAPRTRRAAMWRSYAGLDRLATPQRAAERDLVRVLEVGADRQAAGQAGHRPRRARARAGRRRGRGRWPRRWWWRSWRSRPRARPRRCPPARAARRCGGPRDPRRRSATARRRARGSGRGTRRSARSGSRRWAARRRRSWPPRGARPGRSGRCASVARLKQTSQWPTVALTSRIASASPSASSSETLRMWNASRCAVRCPMPGRRASSVMSRLTGAANKGRRG